MFCEHAVRASWNRRVGVCWTSSQTGFLCHRAWPRRLVGESQAVMVGAWPFSWLLGTFTSVALSETPPTVYMLGSDRVWGCFCIFLFLLSFLLVSLLAILY